MRTRSVHLVDVPAPLAFARGDGPGPIAVLLICNTAAPAVRHRRSSESPRQSLLRVGGAPETHADGWACPGHAALPSAGQRARRGGGPPPRRGVPHRAPGSSRPRVRVSVDRHGRHGVLPCVRGGGPRREPACFASSFECCWSRCRTVIHPLVRVGQGGSRRFPTGSVFRCRLGHSPSGPPDLFDTRWIPFQIGSLPVAVCEQLVMSCVHSPTGAARSCGPARMGPRVQSVPSATRPHPGFSTHRIPLAGSACPSLPPPGSRPRESSIFPPRWW